MKVHLEFYHVFYCVAKAGSISGAAKDLYISQPAVSQAIKHLEAQLGGKLFFRTPKGIVLTTEGESLYQYVEQACGLINTAEQKFCEMQNLLGGEIKIGASDTLCKYYLIPHLERFHHLYPEIRIGVTNRTTPEIINHLKSGKVDLGIVNLPLSETNHLLIRSGAVIQDCFVVGPAYRHLASQEISLAELAKYPVMLLEQGTITRKYIDGLAEGYGVTLVPEVELGSIDLLVEFARIGLGVSFVVKDFIQADLREKKLFEIKLKERIPPRTVGIVTLEDVPLSAAARKFIGILEEREEVGEI